MNYLSDPRDLAVCAVTPTLMAPRYGALPPVAVGQYRFVVASNGVFVQARSRAVDVCLRIGSANGLPYGTLDEYVRLAGGPIPRELGEQLMARAIAATPNEWAGIVVYDALEQAYRVMEPPVSSVSPGHITYATSGYDDELLVLDIHSHGTGHAFFSGTDNRSDNHGVYLASVLGCCKDMNDIEVKTRIVVHGIHYNVGWTPWA